MDVVGIIKHYEEKEIFIEILADAYKLGRGVGWRGYVNWNQKDDWKSEDCGSYPEWEDAFKSAISFAEWLTQKN